MEPLLSIVIANYNYGQYLGEAIESVLGQSCDDYELIVVDAGSTDNSVDVIKRYAERIAWWVSEPDNGQSNAFNKGFFRARGKFLTWLNADDVMLPGTVEKLRCATKSNPWCEWFVGGALWLDPEMKLVKCVRSRRFSETRFKYGSVNVWGPSSFFTKRLLTSVNGVDERFKYKMDTDLWLRFAHYEHARYLPLGNFVWGLRLHPGAKMSGHNFTKNGELDLSRSKSGVDVEERKKAALDKEDGMIKAYFPVRRMGLLVKVFTLPFVACIAGVLDTYKGRGKHYREVVTK